MERSPASYKTIVCPTRRIGFSHKSGFVPLIPCVVALFRQKGHRPHTSRANLASFHLFPAWWLCSAKKDTGHTHPERIWLRSTYSLRGGFVRQKGHRPHTPRANLASFHLFPAWWLCSAKKDTGHAHPERIWLRSNYSRVVALFPPKRIPATHIPGESGFVPLIPRVVALFRQKGHRPHTSRAIWLRSNYSPLCPLAQCCSEQVRAARWLAALPASAHGLSPYHALHVGEPVTAA